ncbi:hypothetical protein M2360_002580 [Rhizobium sp. SG_E_25_P2]|nr:hypothetical protein [Rhizobium sp. SG_E_25_P2]
MIYAKAAPNAAEFVLGCCGENGAENTPLLVDLQRFQRLLTDIWAAATAILHEEAQQFAHGGYFSKVADVAPFPLRADKMGRRQHRQMLRQSVGPEFERHRDFAGVESLAAGRDKQAKNIETAGM